MRVKTGLPIWYPPGIEGNWFISEIDASIGGLRATQVERTIFLKSLLVFSVLTGAIWVVNRYYIRLIRMNGRQDR